MFFVFGGQVLGVVGVFDGYGYEVGLDFVGVVCCLYFVLVQYVEMVGVFFCQVWEVIEDVFGGYFYVEGVGVDYFFGDEMGVWVGVFVDWVVVYVFDVVGECQIVYVDVD